MLFNLDLSSLSGSLLLLFFFCIITVCVFEFINGFHDTANAVATVIYTHSLKPFHAVVWSGLWNFIGVLAGGIGVAMGIINLLPVEILVDQSLGDSIAMMMAVLISAIAWNLGTWYFGIPCSSSHTLIGSLLGVGIAFSIMPNNVIGEGVNWDKAIEIFKSLLLSPLVGFTIAFVLMYILKTVLKDNIILHEANKKGTPPWWIRLILIGTCTSVSYAHGNNDGQKGVGLMMLVLLAFLPAQFALNPDFELSKATQTLTTVQQVLATADKNKDGDLPKKIEKIDKNINEMKTIIAANPQGFADIKQKMLFRKDLMKLNKDLKGIAEKGDKYIPDAENRKNLLAAAKTLTAGAEFAPSWVIMLIALSLGLGTMVGWKRIVITIGEKIGKTHMTYAQGATAEVVTAATIMAATAYKLPVSTTQILSSGVAGTMVASDGTKNLQRATLTNIILAWVLTLPTTILLSGALYFLLKSIF